MSISLSFFFSSSPRSSRVNTLSVYVNSRARSYMHARCREMLLAAYDENLLICALFLLFFSPSRLLDYLQ